MRPLPAALFLILLQAVALAAPPPDDCPPVSCGHLTNVSFPFWVENLQPPSCGFPAFKLICDDQIPRIRISTSDYMVNNISNPDETLILSPMERQSFPCRLLRNSFSLNATPFSLLSTRNSLFFRYNCSLSSTFSGYKHFDCGEKVNSIMGWNEVKDPGVCESVSNLPSVAQRGVDLGNWTEVLGLGFFFKWRTVDCTGCHLSGGKCRYDVEDKQFGCLCGDRLLLGNCKGSPAVHAGTIGAAISGLFSILVLSGVGILVVKKTAAARRRKKSEDEEDDEVEHAAGAPRRFSLEELRAATQGFSKKLGQGGFGSVFEGRVDAQLVAVKRLDCVAEGKKQFLAEVQTIGRIHHFNLVKLMGYCAEKSIKLLVYEFMPNSSLDNWIFPGKERALLGWAMRRKVILGIAKGLAYLHEECAQKIAHLDIKPQNILLDEGFEPKISDFGLAKLIDRDQTQVETRMRGTIGYLAPEWLSSMITEKADVYSFGVVILEIVSRRRNLDRSLPEGEALLVVLASRKAQAGELGDLIDSSLNCTEEESEEATRILQLGLWCLLQDHNKRPSMSTVVRLLEGTAALELNYEDGYPAPRLLLDSSHTEASGYAPLLASVLS